MIYNHIEYVLYVVLADTVNKQYLAIDQIAIIGQTGGLTIVNNHKPTSCILDFQCREIYIPVLLFLICTVTYETVILDSAFVGVVVFIAVYT